MKLFHGQHNSHKNEYQLIKRKDIQQSKGDNFNSKDYAGYTEKTISLTSITDAS